MKANYKVPLRYVEQEDQAGIELRSDTPCFIWKAWAKGDHSRTIYNWNNVEVTPCSNGVFELYIPGEGWEPRVRHETTLRHVKAGDIVFVQLRPNQVRPTVATLKGSAFRHVVLNTSYLDRDPTIGAPQIEVLCKEEKIRAYPDEYELFTLETPTCPDCLRKTWYLLEVQPHFSGKPRSSPKRTKKPSEPLLSRTRFDVIMGVPKPPVVTLSRTLLSTSFDIEEGLIGREGKLRSRVKQSRVNKENKEELKRELLANRKAKKGR